MFFVQLTFLSAFLIESIGSYISIVGLSALFSTNPVIITMALSLDIAKVVTVSFLYKQWNNITNAMKYYMTLAAVILMVITSSGAAGYLSAEFQKAMLPTKGSEIQVTAMTEEKDRLTGRKLDIDKQISQLPVNDVRGRQKLQRQFADELSHINSRIIEIDKALPELQMEQVDVNAHAGPILYIAQAFDTTIESAVKYVILLIIFVFDPLAVALIIAGNFLLDQFKKEQKAEKDAEKAEARQAEIDAEIAKQNAVVALQQAQNVSQIIDEPSQAPAQQEQIHGLGVDLPESEIEILDEIKDQLVNSEFPPLPDDKLAQLSDLNHQLQEILSSGDSNRKRGRGRPKKDEAEPKPAIETDEQLDRIVSSLHPDLSVGNQVETIEDVIEHVVDSVNEEPKALEETSDLSTVEVIASSLGTINSDSADVTFHQAGDSLSNEWKVQKPSQNVYNS